MPLVGKLLQRPAPALSLAAHSSATALPRAAAGTNLPTSLPSHFISGHRQLLASRGCPLGLYRIFEIADLCLGRAPQRVPGTPALPSDFTTVWRGQEETLPVSTVIQELTLKEKL